MSLSYEEFAAVIAECGVLPPEELRALIEALPPQKRPRDAQELARTLVAAGNLTKYQAQRIYAGNGKELVFGQYLLLDKLGQGGMGHVFKARHRVMQRVVALKMLSPEALKSPDAVQRFRREMWAAARLNHPNIVAAFDADQAGNIHYLVMECVDGQDLDSLVKKNGRLPVADAVNYILQAATGLAYAHSQGIVHRDIKPHNLLLDKSGVIKILDMGLARFNDGKDTAASLEGLTQSGVVMGTVDYMAPEQAEDTRMADHRADIYSLGCTLFRLLAARTPYQGDTVMSKLLAHRTRPTPSLRAERGDVPPELDAVVQRMMAKEVAERYQHMEELIADLKACAAGTRLVYAHAAASSSGDAQLSDFLAGMSQQPPAMPGSTATQVMSVGETQGTPKPQRPVGRSRNPPADRKPVLGRFDPALLRNPKVVVPGGALAVAILMLLWFAVRGGGSGEADSSTNKQNTPQVGALSSTEGQLPQFVEDQRRATAERLADEALRPLVAKAANPDTDQIAFRDELRVFLVQHSATPAASKACELLGQVLSRIPSPLDNLDARNLPQDCLDEFKAMGRQLPPELVGVLGEHRRRHWGNTANAVASPDGKWIATTGSHRVVRVWDAGSLRLHTVLKGAGYEAFSVAFSPDSRRLAFSDGSAAVRFWEIQDDAFNELTPLAGHGNNTSSIIFSPDSKSVAYASNDKSIWLWDISGPTPRPRHVWKDLTAPAKELSIAPDGRTLFFHCGNGVVQRWNLEQPIPVEQDSLRLGEKDQLWSIAVSPDSLSIATACASGRASVWDLQGAQPREHILGESGAARVAFAPNGQMLAVGTTGSGDIQIWSRGDSGFEKQPSLKGHQSTISSLAFSRNSRWLLAYANRTSYLWDLQAASERYSGQGQACFSVDNARLFQLSANIIRAYDVATGTEVEPVSGPVGAMRAVAFVPDGERLLYGGNGKSLYCCDLTKSTELTTFPRPTEAVLDVAVSPDGEWAVIADESGHLWNLVMPQEAAALEKRQTGGHTRSAFSPDGKSLARGFSGGAMEIWDFNDGHPRLRWALKGHDSNVHGLAYAPDGQRLATSGNDHLVRLWDMSGSEPKQRGQIGRGPGVSDNLASLTFAPDGNTLVVASTISHIRLWEASWNPRQRAMITAHPTSIAAVAFSPSGAHFASAGADGRIVLWDPSTTGKLREWQLSGPVNAVVFAPDGRHLATANANGTVYIFRLFPRGSRLQVAIGQ